MGAVDDTSPGLAKAVAHAVVGSALALAREQGDEKLIAMLEERQLFTAQRLVDHDVVAE